MIGGYHLYPIGPKLDINTGVLRTDTLSARIAGGAGENNKTKPANKPRNSASAIADPLQIISNYIGSDGCIGKCRFSPAIDETKEKIGAGNYTEVAKALIAKADPKVSDQIAELKEQLKPDGPTDTTWMSNFNIEDVLSRLSKVPEHKFVAFRCELRDFDSDGRCALDAFECTPGWCYGIVLNTDKSPGRGEHWIAVFADLRADDRWTVEFFNSGKSTFPEFAKLISDWAAKLRKIEGAPSQIDTLNVVKKQIQFDNTECGVYSVIFVIGRVINIPSEAFNGEHAIPFKKINEMRKVLFNN